MHVLTLVQYQDDKSHIMKHDVKQTMNDFNLF